jgi:plastocyanin
MAETSPRSACGYARSVSLRRPVVALLVLASSVLLACGSDETAADQSSSEARAIEITATEYEFNGDPGVIEAGDTIEFDVENVGEVDHSLEVLSSSGTSLGRTQRIAPGASASVTVTFDDAGVYRLICDVDDHLSRGQTASISVG